VNEFVEGFEGVGRDLVEVEEFELEGIDAFAAFVREAAS
jgi:hypothetical protein